MGRPRPYRAEDVRSAYVDYATGAGVLDTGAPLDVAYRPKDGRMTLTGLLETARAAGVRRVLLTGPRPSGRWLEAPVEGWRADPRGHYYDADDPCGRFVGPTAADRVELRRAAAWLGDGPYTPRQAREAMALVASLLRGLTRGSVGLMASPAATGQSLWAWTLPAEWDGAQLGEELASLVRSSSPQHRMETVGSCYGDCRDHLPVPKGKLGGLHYLDGRFMYLACTRERAAAPARPLTADQATELVEGREHARAWLFGLFMVPRDWTGPGLLPVKHDDGTHWHYPNRPGVTGWTWADSLEWWQAMRSGWGVALEGGYELVGRPVLDSWTRRVLTLREQAAAADADETTRELAKAALRMMALTTIGAFHSRGRDRTIVADGPKAIPHGVTHYETRPDGSVVYRLPTTLDGNAAAMQHPELSAQVWAMARWRVASAMLTVPYESLVAVWGDAVWLDRDPGWADDGRVGRLRRKGFLDGPLTRPRNLTALAKLRDRMVVK